MESTVPDTFPALFIGYTVIWVLFLGYLVRINLKLKELERIVESDRKENGE